MSQTEKGNSRSVSPAADGHSPRDGVVFNILRTAGFLRRHYAELFEKHGITMHQYNVVRILRGAGEEGLPTLEIAERMMDPTPGITRLLDRLEAKKLVRRERPPNNRRKVICHVTEHGLRLLKELESPLKTQARSAVQMLNDGEIEVLLRTLSRIRMEG